MDIISVTRCNPNKILVIPNFDNPLFQYIPKKINTLCPHILHIETKSNKNLERNSKALKVIPCRLVIIGELTLSQRQVLEENQID